MNIDLKILNDYSTKPEDKYNGINGIEIDLEKFRKQSESSIYEDTLSHSDELFKDSDFKRIDFVLVYQKSSTDDANPLNHDAIRKKFEVFILIY